MLLTHDVLAGSGGAAYYYKRYLTPAEDAHKLRLTKIESAIPVSPREVLESITEEQEVSRCVCVCVSVCVFARGVTVSVCVLVASAFPPCLYLAPPICMMKGDFLGKKLVAKWIFHFAEGV